ncbi:thiopeptide-type bacteriocin biosynthesis protein [Amycolatopsis vastitatis]|uniref:Methyltransferase n=1 Tax=Amycolatopsis vastitatis TaxID=1905142 RepID=A0A229SL93_9PSEU|nr:thiopeptide-type bacteriocin biosynthesis protein [Amycolatopsis vastitatis]OXM59668.1 methyltransferase [Amycolatopsis vastitatis]
MTPSWCQVFVQFNDWDAAEGIAVTDLAPVLTDAEDTGLISSWFFIRKAPCWRVRFLPHDQDTAPKATERIHQRLATLENDHRITRSVKTIYEPETHAFGGPTAMETAHRLFHQDSHHILTYLGSERDAAGGADDQRRELSILLCSAMMRSAQQDWHEQGDIWARVAEHRTLPPDTPQDRLRDLEPSLQRLMTTDTEKVLQDNGTFASWAAAFTQAGARLGDLAMTGGLDRGVRAVLAKHVIFAWNRLGLSHTRQSILANVARAAVFAS